MHIHKELKKSTFIFKSINIHNPNERIFSGWGSVEIIDKQGDIIPIKEFEPVMKILMRRGAPIVDSHSNHKVGEIISYKFRDNEKGERGLYLTAKIYKDYPTDDEVWEGIKNGDYAGFSLGGKAGEKIPICNREGCYNVVKDIEVWEFSVVEKPANQKSLIDHVNKLAKSDEIISFIVKGNKVYIKNPSEAPKGVKVERGPKGGYYYEETKKPSDKKHETKDENSKRAITADPEYGPKYYEIKRQWKHDIEHDIAIGKLSPEEADKLGWYDQGKLELLPKKLFHVTTAKTKVEQTGLKTRDELIMESGAGLGGGASNTISFTTDLKIAEQISTAILEGRKVARNEITIDELLEQSKKGINADKPWYDELVKNINLKEKFERLKTGMKNTSFSMFDPPKYVKLTEEELIEDRFDIYKHWLTYREFAGGPLDPLFFSSDSVALSNINPEEIKTLELSSKEGTMGYQVGALGEWRTYSGDTVKLTNIQKSHIIQKPFAGYENFDECVAQNRDKDKAEAYCGTIKYRVEKGRVRISSPSDAPTGVKIERGPRGGYYYDSEGQPEQHSQTILRNYARIKTSKLSGQLKNIAKQLKENKSSKYKYFDSDKKEYTPERKALHENIINSFIGKNSKSVGKRKAILVGGPPASGKTTLLKDLNINFDDYVSINNDNIKEKLPGYSGVNAALYHDEARDIVNKLIDKSITENRNLILDGTMRDYDKERKKIENLHKIGYMVRVIGIKSDPNTVINRATTRFLEENGRYVPLQHIAKTTPIINDTIPKYEKLVDNFELWDSSKFPSTKVV